MFKRMYLRLFNRITDALRALDAGDVERTRQILIAAQQECEARYVEAEET